MSGILRALRRASGRLPCRRKKKRRPKRSSGQYVTDDIENTNEHSKFLPKHEQLDNSVLVDVHEDTADGIDVADSDDVIDNSMDEKRKLDQDKTSEDTSSISMDSDEERSSEKGSKWKFRKRVKEKILQKQFDECEPEVCVDMLRTPTVKAFTALKKKLKKTDKAWTQGFLDGGGLDVLLDAIDIIGGRRVTELSEALKVLECVSCVTKLVNSKMGMSFLVQHGSYTKKLIKGK
jgi:hypothetical protein